MFKVFEKLIRDQFEYGGAKYSYDNNKEATDLLFDTYGYCWLIGTIAKYTYRYTNVERERDLLKISAYMYIIWLKRGFHLNLNGLLKVIDTNLQNKKDNFDKFISKVKTNTKSLTVTIDNIMTIRNILEKWAERDHFRNIQDNEIYDIFMLAYDEWKDKFSHKAGKDTDTYNESKLKNEA